MQRILHINDYPADTGGGAEVVMKNTIDLLRQRGLTVETFTSADLPDPRRTPWRYLDNLGARRALAARLASFRPQVVHLHNYYHVLSPGILAELADCKLQRPFRVVMTAHDYHLVCPNSGGSCFRLLTGRRKLLDPKRMTRTGYLLSRSWDHRSFLHSWLKLLQHVLSYRWKRLHRVIDLVICPSRFIQQLLTCAGLPCCYLPHPVPAEKILLTQRGRHNPPEGDTDGMLHMVFAGRLEPEKGLNEFLQLWPDDLQACLTVVGTGGDLPRCRQTCKERGLLERVRFLGRLPYAQTMAEIGQSHLLVMPSRLFESYGLVLIEALASGTNILASNIGALREIVEASGVGFLFELDDPVSLREQLDLIRARFEDGTLNRFDLAGFLDERSEAHYAEQLLEAYQVASPVVQAARLPGA